MKHIQAIARMFFRAFVIGMIILTWDEKAIWAIPFALLIGLLSEAEYLAEK